MEHHSAGPFDPPPPAGAGSGGDVLTYLDVVFAAVLGYRPLRLDLRVPRGDGPWPLVVRVHGGAWWEGSRARHPTPADQTVFQDHLAGRGYAVATIEYRLTREAVFPAQLHDVKAAIRWLRAFASELRLDPARFAAWGDSAGGHLAALAGLTADHPDPTLEGEIGVRDTSSAVAAVVDWYGVATLMSDPGDSPLDPSDPDNQVAWLLGGPFVERRAEAALASPVNYVQPSSPPFLCVHGTEDAVCPYAQSVLLTETLRAQGVRCDLHPVVGAGHELPAADVTRLTTTSVDFLDETLGTHAGAATRHTGSATAPG